MWLPGTELETAENFQPVYYISVKLPELQTWSRIGFVTNGAIVYRNEQAAQEDLKLALMAYRKFKIDKLLCVEPRIVKIDDIKQYHAFSKFHFLTFKN